MKKTDWYDRFFSQRKILVTGGTGSIGSELVKSLLHHGVTRVVVLSKDDSKQYMMKHRLISKENISFILGDVREYETLKEATRGMDLVFHTAALKQIGICEDNPKEAILTNTMGTVNIIRACLENRVQKLINISTDKAVHPTSIMGATKFLSEKLIQEASRRPDVQTRFCSIRFGNVLNSRGSVIPLWLEQYRSGQPLQVTDLAMTRFAMTIPQAVELIKESAFLCQGGETFIFKMKSVRLGDLVQAMKAVLSDCNMNGAQFVLTGPRPGEKSFEQLLFADEAKRLFENEQLYVVLPHQSSSTPQARFKRARHNEYRSDLAQKWSVPELVALLRPVIKQSLGDETNG